MLSSTVTPSEKRKRFRAGLAGGQVTGDQPLAFDVDQ